MRAASELHRFIPVNNVLYVNPVNTAPFCYGNNTGCFIEFCLFRTDIFLTKAFDRCVYLRPFLNICLEASKFGFHRYHTVSLTVSLGWVQS